MWCDNPREHKREGERDYERHGRYGYDSRQYNDHWDDCAKHYREGFDEAKREDDLRQELREEREAQERQEERRVRQQRQEQSEWEEQQDYLYQEDCEQQEKDHSDLLNIQYLHSLKWSRKRIRKWCQLKGVKL